MQRRSGWRKAISRSLSSGRSIGSITTGHYRDHRRRVVCRSSVLEKGCESRPSGVLADPAHLGEDGGVGAVLALLVGDHMGDRVDQGEVGEGLWEVAEVAARLRLQLLGVEVEPSRGLEQPLAELARALRLPPPRPGPDHTT